jgi:hypothetical protein
MRGFARSFSGGELTPEFFGQVADAKFQTGLALCRNFEILPHGPTQNRGGFEYVATVKTPAKKTRLIPFTYSTTQTMVLQFGEGYIRFHTLGQNLLVTATPWSNFTTYSIGDHVTNGGLVYVCILGHAPPPSHAPPNATYWTLVPGGIYEVATPYAEADLFGIHFVQSADVLTLVHPNYPPMELRRLGATNWTLTTITFATTLPAPTSVTVAETVGGTPTTPSVQQYAVTAVASNNIDESLVSQEAFGDSFTITAFTLASLGVGTTSTSHFMSVGDPVFIFNAPGWNGLYTINTVPTGTTFTLALNGTPLNTSGFPAWVSGLLSLAGARNNLFDTGAFNLISWGAVAGAKRYNVYRFSNGLWGYIGQASGTTFKDTAITPNIAITPPENYVPFGSTGNYPGAVSYYEQRRCFAGTINSPQSMWLTRTGTESNLTYHIPTQDPDSIQFRVAAREANTIRHLVPLYNLLALTSSAEWRITSVNSDALTQTSASVKPQSYIGANNVQPVIANNNVVFAAARGGHARELAYSYAAMGYAGGFVTGDLSLRACHLFDTFDIADMTYCKAPRPVVWMASTSGKLLGLTYVPEQQIGAWHQHDTDGSFESVTAVAEGGEDILYAVVNRTLNGVQTRTIERKRSRAYASLADSFFVDCGQTYVGAPATVVSGFSWLIGETVSILADGAVVAQQVVDNTGAITLPNAASKVSVGLPITADMQTLPMALMIDGYGQGRPKNVNRVYIRVKDSSGIFVGPDFNSLVQFKQRTTEPYGSPPALHTGEVEIVSKAAWTDGGQACIRQSDPLPLTVISIELDVAVGG